MILNSLQHLDHRKKNIAKEKENKAAKIIISDTKYFD